MKIHYLIYAVPTLMALPAVHADISLGRPAARQVENEPGVYHSDLLASNAVLAVFKELRSIPIVSLETATPTTAQVAVFEVKQNLAHRRYDRMGDGPLQPGKLFPVTLAADVPGQDAALAEQIRTMKPGDEAVMNIDHIYIFREEGNENVRACTRFAKAEQQPADAAPIPPTAAVSSPTPAPAAVSSPAAQDSSADDSGIQTFIRMGGNSGSNSAYGSSVSTSIVMKPDAQGVMRRTKVEIRREYSGGKETVRKFINDVEVDPQTDQPLDPATTDPQDAPKPKSSADSLPPIPDPPADPGNNA